MTINVAILVYLMNSFVYNRYVQILVPTGILVGILLLGCVCYRIVKEKTHPNTRRQSRQFPQNEGDNSSEQSGNLGEKAFSH